MNPHSTKFKVLSAVIDHYEVKSFGPTVEEIAEEVGLGGRSTVQFHINDLRDQHLLTNLPNRPRTLRATEKGEKLVELLRTHGDS
jgi:SOS-response transcriptional repressor LexA